MQPRLYEMVTGIESLPAAEAGIPSDPADIIALEWLQDNYKRKAVVTGSIASPTAISAGTAIQHNLVADDQEAIIFIEGNGGAVDMSVNPQVAVPTAIGQKLTIVGCSDSNTVKLEDGTGLALNGEIILTSRKMITLIALSLTQWDEYARP